jgi:hypothetical protein
MIINNELDEKYEAYINEQLRTVGYVELTFSRWLSLQGYVICKETGEYI